MGNGGAQDPRQQPRLLEKDSHRDPARLFAPRMVPCVHRAHVSNAFLAVRKDQKLGRAL